MRYAVTGAKGRVGHALVAALERRNASVTAWTRAEFDLDDPRPAAALARDTPDVVFHCAAWTDVDGCGRDPELALRRNGTATRELAQACARAGASLVYVSTNEVFDGARVDGVPYEEEDAPAPANAYGRSKLAGEEAVRNALGDAGKAWVVRTSWVFGGGTDFPAKVLTAARKLEPAGELRMVADEYGRPTHAADLADGLVALIDTGPGTYHLANAGHASRFEWARHVLDRCLPGTAMVPISLDDYVRPSRPPRWGVLGTRRAEAAGIVLAPWRDALDRYLDELCQP